ncbi:hypothetical protein L0F51_00110 [Afifella sp. H1R]|uniref:hypothetical protein n=1 Tax=Afifella sp. H1R TaxID=2908841 RepID=UPI001F3B28A5|nr:hypothetical protein [Afifella sp. H1R]MCF1502169.1 hypothetical protein [Afifella sp. H1R]
MKQKVDDLVTEQLFAQIASLKLLIGIFIEATLPPDDAEAMQQLEGLKRHIAVAARPEAFPGFSRGSAERLAKAAEIDAVALVADIERRIRRAGKQ